MFQILSLAILFSIVFALPQVPSDIAPPAPTPSPKIVGQLPVDGLNGLPWPGFQDLASALGFDPSKGTARPGATG
jgi:hypothetical protein